MLNFATTLICEGFLQKDNPHINYFEILVDIRFFGLKISTSLFKFSEYQFRFSSFKFKEPKTRSEEHPKLFLQ